METVFRRHGDLGDMAEELLTGKTAGEGLPFSRVSTVFETLAGLRRTAQKLDLLEDLLRCAHPTEAKYIHESGYALRFPRIVRLRSDKPGSEIDTLDRVKEHYERQFGRRREQS